MKYLLIVLAFLTPTVFGDAGTTTVMHRIFAGNIDTQGWAVAESTQGSFSVRVPGPFNDFTVTGGPPDSPERTEAISGKATTGIVFSVLQQIFTTKDTSATEFEAYKDGGGLPGASVKPTTVDGAQALDITYSDGAAAGVQRVILAGSDLFVLTLRWPSSAAETASAQSEKFLDSFRQLSAPASRPEATTIWQPNQLNENYMRSLTKDACMAKTIATLSRSGCGTKECQASIAGATGNCATWASGDKAAFCAKYKSRYVDKACGPAGGLDSQRCAFLDIVKDGICSAAPSGK